MSNYWLKWLRERWLLLLLIIFITFLVVGPLVFLAIGSLRTAPPGAPGEWSFAGYQAIASTRALLAYNNTIIVAVVVAVLATCMGTLLAWLQTRTDLSGKTFFQTFTSIPIFISPVLLSIAWIILVNPSNGLINFAMERLTWLLPFGNPLNIYSLAGIIWVEVIFYTPYSYLFIVGPMQSVDPALEEAAIISGASRFRTLRTVTFPLLAPAITSALFVILVRSAEMFAVPLILGYQSGVELIASLMYNLLEFYPPNHAMAGAMGIALIVFLVFLDYLRRRVVGKRKFYTVTGKGYRPRVTPLGKWKTPAYILLGIYGFVGLVLPIGVIVLVSFLTYYNPNINIAMFTLRNYKRVLFENSMTIGAISNSIVVSVVGAIVAMLIALILGFIITRHRNRLSGFLDTVANLPLALPAVVMGLAMLWFFVHWPSIFYGTILTIGIALVTRFLGYGIRSISSGLSQIHPELEESSRTLGASWTYTLQKITFPLMKPAIFAGWVLLVATFMRDLALVLFLYRPGAETLSVAVYNLWLSGQLPQAAALTVIQVIIVIAIVAIGRLLFRVKATAS